MNISMGYPCPILLVFGPLRQSAFFTTEDRRLIHVYPNAKDIVSPFKGIFMVERGPEFLGSFIQKVYPDTVSRPTVPGISLQVVLLYPDILIIFSQSINLITFLVDMISSSLFFDVRICNHNYSPSALSQFFCHFQRTRERASVECEIFIVVSMRNVEPEHIQREIVLFKILVIL